MEQRLRVVRWATGNIGTRAPTGGDLSLQPESLTANRAVNAVPYVCAVPRGFVSTAQLGSIVPNP
jgi:hypothetical protein